jgi:hypothetical protein
VSTAQARALARARRIVAEYQLDTPSSIDIEAIAFAHGLLVVYAPLEGAAARLLRKGSRGVVRVSTGIDIEGQKRFCIAHELGHFLVHGKEESLAACTAKDMLPWQGASGLEPEANAFAAELLMPEEMFRSVAPRKPTLSSLESLTESFRTTITATLYRYVELSLAVTALVATHEGKIRWFNTAKDFGYRLRAPGSTLDARTCAASFFSAQPVSKTEADVPAQAWLDDGRVEDTWTVRELMIPMPRFKSALCLLWVIPGSQLDQA